MSYLFQGGIKIRNLFFDRNWIKETKVPAFVISIGNIIAGGTGKTPLVQMLAKDLSQDRKVAILSRGYRSNDEPTLLSKTLPHISLLVGKNRKQNAKRAVLEGANLILLDDGMQYRSLHRDLELVILHAEDLYGKGFYLPRGYLRDSPKRLREADYLFINHVREKGHFESYKKEIRRCTSSPIIGTRMVISHIIDSSGKKWDKVEGVRIGVFCGLGKPDSFFQTVKDLGADIIKKWILPDHTRPDARGLVEFSKRCKKEGCELILCSEKDWVKLSRPVQGLSLPLGYTEAKMQVIFGQNHYDELLAL